MKLRFLAAALSSALAVTPMMANAQESPEETGSIEAEEEAIEEGSDSSSLGKTIDTVLGDVSTVLEDVSNVASDIAEAIGSGDLGTLIDDTIGDIFGGETGALGLPDTIQLEDVISDKPAGLLSPIGDSLGLGGEEFSIRDDIELEGALQVAEAVASGTGLSQSAQESSVQMMESATQNAATSAQLSEDSQNADATQQIMQNIAEQNARDSQTDAMIMQSLQRSNLNDAVQTQLESATLEEIGRENREERIEDSATSGLSTSYSGQLMLPGASTENSEEAP